MNDAFHPLFSLDEGRRHYFSVLGRALYTAQHLEMNCRAIVGFISVRVGHIKNGDSVFTDKSFLEGIARLWKKNTLGTNSNLLKNMSVITGDISTTFDAALAARNEIAHHIAIGIDDNLDSELDDRLCHILELVRAIAGADLIASILILQLNKEPLPQVAFVESYIDRVVCWVGE